MKLTKYLAVLFLVFSVLFVVQVGSVGASPCVANLTDIEECTLTTGDYLQLARDTYYLNDSNFTGVIILLGNNIYLDLNGSTIRGNSTPIDSTPATTFIVGTSRNNITITNGNIYNYQTGLKFNTLPSNLSFINISAHYNRIALTLTSANNTYIFNSNFTNNAYAGIYMGPAHNVNISNNYFNNDTIFIDYITSISRNISIHNNIFNKKDKGIGTSYNLVIGNASEIDIFNNSFYNSTYFGSIQIRYAFGNIDIHNNLFDLNDRAISGEANGYGIKIYNNNFLNSHNNIDAYDTPIYFIGPRLWNSNNFNYTNISIYNNNFTNFGCTGILLRDVFDSYIYNNTFYQNISYLIQQKYNCFNEPFTAIFIHQVYKGFVPSGSLGIDNYTIASNHTSSNINISGNTFNGINVLLRVQGSNNIKNDLSNYWYKSFQNVYSLNKEEWFINNEWNNVSTLYNQTYTGLGGTLSIILASSSSNAKIVFNFSFVKGNYDYFVNVNSSNRQINIYNLTTFLAYNTNGSTYGSQVIANNIGDINITLEPNNATYILDNFNLTEGVTRQASPLSITSPSSTSKTITSTLTNTINTSIRIGTSYPLGRIKSVSYASALGYSRTVNQNQLSYVGGYIDLNNVNVDAGTNTVAITLNEGAQSNADCQGVTTTIQNTIYFAIPLIVLAGVFMLLASFGIFGGNISGENVDWNLFGVVALGVVVIGLILLVGMVIVSGIPC